MAKDEKLYRTLVSDNSIYISWVEDIYSYSPKDIKFDYLANIVINPLPNHLFRLRLFLSVLLLFLLLFILIKLFLIDNFLLLLFLFLF